MLFWVLKALTWKVGKSPHPPPMCSIHLDDATAAILHQNNHHTPATGGEETEWWSQSVYEDDYWIQFWVTSSFLNTLAWILQQMLFEYFTHACSVVILCLCLSYIKYNAFQSTFSQILWTFVLRLKSWKACEESSLRRQECSLTESSSLLNFWSWWSEANGWVWPGCRGHTSIFFGGHPGIFNEHR